MFVSGAPNNPRCPRMVFDGRQRLGNPDRRSSLSEIFSTPISDSRQLSLLRPKNCHCHPPPSHAPSPPLKYHLLKKIWNLRSWILYYALIFITCTFFWQYFLLIFHGKMTTYDQLDRSDWLVFDCRCRWPLKTTIVKFTTLRGGESDLNEIRKKLLRSFT